MPAFWPLRAIRPAAGMSGEVVSLPYDVVETEEARELAKRQKHSFYHVVRSEIDFPPGADPYGPEIYEKARSNFLALLDQGVLIRDTEEAFYLYRLKRGSQVQTGIVGLVSVDDYRSGSIKRHELTRREKEADRIKHIDTLSACTGPVFLAYRSRAAGDLLSLVNQLFASGDVLYSDRFDDVEHSVVRIQDPALVEVLGSRARSLEYFYIADGHHRAASAAQVVQERRDRGKLDHRGAFLAVIFADDELKILPYNRAVCDLNGHSPDSLLTRIQEVAHVTEDRGQDLELHMVRVLLKEQSYVLSFKPELYQNADAISALDVSLLQDHILKPVLGIEDPRSSDRIKFVGGIHGEAGLRTLLDSGSYQVAFSLFPTSLAELFAVADNDAIMPPKSTWFEPKLRSGYFIYELGT